MKEKEREGECTQGKEKEGKGNEKNGIDAGKEKVQQERKGKGKRKNISPGRKGKKRQENVEKKIRRQRKRPNI